MIRPKKQTVGLIVVTGVVLGIIGVIAYGFFTTPMSAFYPRYNNSQMQECGTISLTVVNDSTTVSSQDNCFPMETSFSSGQSYNPCYAIVNCTTPDNATTLGTTGH